MAPRLEIVGDVETGAPYLAWGRQQHALGLFGVRQVEDGAITVDIQPEFVRVIVAGGLSGIICHPRSGVIQQITYRQRVDTGDISYWQNLYTPGVVGGWQDGTTPLTTEYPFPLIDEDNASFILQPSLTAGEFSSDFGNYGNLYWTNGNADDPVILSWRGTPTRHFRLGGEFDIPGLSTPETALTGVIEDKPIYTTFGTKVYQNGAVYADAPRYNWPYPPGPDRCLVLGACADSTGKVYIVTHSDHYAAPSPVIKGGIYLTLWREGQGVDGWEIVAEHLYGRNGLPWFANSSGTEFICGNGDRLTTTGVLSRKASVVGTQQELVGDSIRFSYGFENSDYYEFAGNDVAKSDVSLVFAAESSRVAAGQVVQDYPPPYDILLEHPVQPLVLVRHLVGGSMAAYGGEMPYTFSPDTMCSCGSTFVTVTDACGNTDSGLVRGGTSENSEWVEDFQPYTPVCTCQSVARLEYTTVNGTLIYQFCTSQNVTDCTGKGYIPQDTSVETALRETASTYTKINYCQAVSKISGECITGCTQSQTSVFTWQCKSGYTC